MQKQTQYFVYRSHGRVGRVAKFVDGLYPYGWDKGKWVFMPGLIKIKFDITDYEEITKKEALKLIR